MKGLRVPLADNGGRQHADNTAPGRRAGYHYDGRRPRREAKRRPQTRARGRSPCVVGGRERPPRRAAQGFPNYTPKYTIPNKPDAKARRDGRACKSEGCWLGSLKSAVNTPAPNPELLGDVRDLLAIPEEAYGILSLCSRCRLAPPLPPAS